MDDPSEPDLISDLPLSIMESILTLLPIRDAVKTSVLSSKWRYRWASIQQLVFDDRCVDNEKPNVQGDLANFITHCLLLHNAPIHKFKLCTTQLQGCPDIDQWILFLSRRDIKELFVELYGEEEWFRAPASLFSCSKLTHLELSRCELDPPSSFKGFSFLRVLSLQQVSAAPEVIENLIANSPLLKKLSLSYFDSLELSISAPNLKILYLDGEFREINLVNAPLLVDITVALYMPDDYAELFEHSSHCNFEHFLGGVSNLERLVGYIYFAKYLSIGIEQWEHKVTYHHLKIIELYRVSFEDIDEILVILHLIMSSPNLEELHISGSSNTVCSPDDPDMIFLETQYPSGCRCDKLKSVRITDLSGLANEMEFVKFLLGNAPALQMMYMTPSCYVSNMKTYMLIELLRFRRASPRAQIIFTQD